ncbi:MAG: DUF1836 domain-containing protein [Ruminococcaceae bacterium]|nr:DUF1836 domain-containing protein [Oscillospiraceae bacterium]
MNIKESFAAIIADFRLPRYNELPNMGLYLDQVTKYINGYITPLGLAEITPSMVSNYVKKGVVTAPVKKQYNADQIAYLMFVTIGKTVLSIENITQLFSMQKLVYDAPTAYDYFCCEFENILRYISGLKDNLDRIGQTDTDEKDMLRSVIIALSNVIYVNNCFETKKAASD